MEKSEENKLIARFQFDANFEYAYYANYDENWNWLMVVVEKIESIEDPYHGYFGVHICSNGCTIQATNFRSENKISNPPYYFADYTLETKIEATWTAVVEFIKWYNGDRTAVFRPAS